MAFVTDFTLLNNTGTADWNTVNFDTPQLNDANNPTPFYLEGAACFYWWLKKGQTGSTDQSTSGITGGLGSRICVAWMNYPYAEIGAIPITTFDLRLGSSSFTSNYIEQDALVQLEQPYNLPISGHTPIMLHPGNVTGSNGTFSTTGTTLYYGWSVVTGNDNDGKQGGFDWFLVIGMVGAHSATYTQTYFSTVYSEAYDSNGGGIPGTNNRPLGIMSKSGNNYTVNVNLQMGNAGATTTTVTETGKSVYFSNISSTQNVGYVFVNGTGDLNVTLTDIVHSWNDQEGTNPEIFDGAENCDILKVTGCSFTNGGQLNLAADSANRWVRGCNFSNIKSQSLSDSELTDSTITGSDGMTVSGDADLTGTSILLSAVATDASAMEWNGNFDPDGNLDGMTFSKGTNAHHAIGFGASVPTTMTLRDIDFSGFNASNAQNDSTLYFADTSGTVTVNLSGCTGDISYKSAGATINLVAGAVTTEVTVKSLTTGLPINGAYVRAEVTSTAAGFPYQDSVTITGTGTTATVTHTGHGLATGDKIIIRGASPDVYNGGYSITETGANSYTYTTSETIGSSPATGTITATFAFLLGSTNASGYISDSRVVSTNQPITGVARKSTSSPFYQQGVISGTVDSTGGYSATILLADDE